jgi:hypothetical protein
MSTPKVFLLLLIIVNLFINSNCISCGKKNPTKEKHCTKYGTDSGFVCCSFKTSQGIECQLKTFKWAENNEIKGVKDFQNGTVIDCGNNSKYLKISLMLFLFLFLIF